MAEVCIKTGKHSHLSQGKAEAHLRHLKETGYEGVVYSCQYCEGWHVGRLKQNAHKNKYKN
jgi:hypothetical protein